MNTKFILSINMLRSFLLSIKILIKIFITCSNFISFIYKLFKFTIFINSTIIFEKSTKSSIIIPKSKNFFISSFRCFNSIKLINFSSSHHIINCFKFCTFNKLRNKNKFSILNLTRNFYFIFIIIMNIVIKVLLNLNKFFNISSAKFITFNKFLN